MRTPEEVYQDFSMRRKGILRALTSECGPLAVLTFVLEAKLAMARSARPAPHCLVWRDAISA